MSSIYLHNNKNLFKKIILEISKKNKINPIIIEKDYYVTLFLSELNKIQPNLIFKGGTSLSKCFHAINRFSEDIDLSIEFNEKASGSLKKELIENINKTIYKHKFNLINEKNVFSRRDYNRYEININMFFSSFYIKKNLIVETALFFPSYPLVEAFASSYIYDYLLEIKRNDIINQYSLNPFKLLVQSKERTFVDKIFAICDYYLSNNIESHSRHLYDLYKLSFLVKIDSELFFLIKKVKNIRKLHKTCLSAQDNINIKDCLKELLIKDVYEKDYSNTTTHLIFENVMYFTVKKRLLKIIKSSCNDI